MLKKSKLFLALALAFIMCFASISIPSLAAGPGFAAETSQAAINKILKVPAGTNIPDDMFFTFQVTATGSNGETSDEAKAAAAAAIVSEGGDGVVTIDFAGTVTQSVTYDNNTSIYNKESGGLFDVSKYLYAGIYSYKIKENSNTYIIDDPLHEAMVYSQAEYDVQVYVKEDKDNEGKLVIAFIGVIRETYDDGSDVDPDDQEKLDPTPIGTPGHEFIHSEMTFTNEYIKTNGPDKPDVPDPDPKDSTLDITKTVKGLFSSTTKYFDFTLTLKLPDLIGDYENYTKEFYIAYLYDNDTLIDPSNNVGSELIGTVEGGTTKYIKFTPDTAVPFKLRDGQTLMFVNTPVGTRYAVTESAAPNYTPTTSVIYNGGTAKEVTSTIANTPFSVDNGMIGEAANSTTFINDSGSSTPTGLNLNDLPFIGLIALAIGALILFVVIKSRKKRNASQY